MHSITLNDEQLGQAIDRIHGSGTAMMTLASHLIGHSQGDLYTLTQMVFSHLLSLTVTLVEPHPMAKLCIWRISGFTTDEEAVLFKLKHA